MYVLMDTHTGTHIHSWTMTVFIWLLSVETSTYLCLFFFLDTRGSSQSALPDVPHSVSGVQVCLVMNSVCTLCLYMCLHFGHYTNRPVFLCVSAAASGLETDAAFRAAVVGGPGSVQECLSGGNSTSWKKVTGHLGISQHLSIIKMLQVTHGHLFPELWHPFPVWSNQSLRHQFCVSVNDEKGWHCCTSGPHTKHDPCQGKATLNWSRLTLTSPGLWPL